MEEGRRAKRVFTPEQKMHIVQSIDADIASGLTTTKAVEKSGVCYGNYRKWKSQLSVGVKSSLRNGRPPVDADKRKLERENEKLKAIILSQSQTIADLKKETNWE
jgi:hypothetical protein